MTSTTTSIYSAFANHNAATISDRAFAARAKGDGMGWGSESMTLAEAAADMGALVLGQHEQGLLCELSDRLYVLCDSHGPWAVEVATLEDLTHATPSLTPAALANLAETGTDYRRDLAALRSGATTEEALLEHCLDGADDDRVEGWREYVSALVAAVAA